MENCLEKNKPSEIKDCFETLNRATFVFNQALDEFYLSLLQVYKTLPAPVKTGVSNSLDIYLTLQQSLIIFCKVILK